MAPVAKPVVRKTPTKRTPKAPKAQPAKTAPTSKEATSRPTVATSPKVRPVAKPPTVEDRPPSRAVVAPTRSRRRDILPILVLALFAAASMAIGSIVLVNGLKDSGNNGDVATARTQASAAAGSAAETIFSFRYDKLDDHLSASQALMTPKFAKDFKKLAPALTELAPQRKIVVKAAVSDAAALPCGSNCATDKAEVLVFLDQARLIGDSKTPTVFANRIKVSMVRSGGDWLVSDIRAL